MAFTQHNFKNLPFYWCIYKTYYANSAQCSCYLSGMFHWKLLLKHRFNFSILLLTFFFKYVRLPFHEAVSTRLSKNKKRTKGDYGYIVRDFIKPPMVFSEMLYNQEKQHCEEMKKPGKHLIKLKPMKRWQHHINILICTIFFQYTFSSLPDNGANVMWCKRCA